MPTVHEIKLFILDVAEDLGVNPLLALAVARQESGFDPLARNAASGAFGIFQLMPGTAGDMGVGATYKTDWQQNVLGGVKYLQQLMSWYHGDSRLDVLLAGYNWGPGNVNRLISGGATTFPTAAAVAAYPADVFYSRLPAETQTYIQKVTGYMVEFSSDPLVTVRPTSQPTPVTPQISLTMAAGIALAIALFFLILSSKRD